MRSILAAALLAVTSAARATQPVDVPLPPPPAGMILQPTSPDEAPLPAAPAAHAARALEVDLLAGGRFPQLASRLGTGLDGLLRLGWAGLLDGRLQLLFEVGYGQPSRTMSASDARLAAGSYDATLTVQDLGIGAGAVWRFPAIRGLVPYAGAVLQTHLVKSLATGSAGGDFGQNTETATLFGAAALGGVRWTLGPGVLLGELRRGAVPVNQTLTGASNLGSATLLVGYGLSF